MEQIRYLDPVIITSSKMSIAAAEDVTLTDCLQMSEMGGRWEKMLNLEHSVGILATFDIFVQD